MQLGQSAVQRRQLTRVLPRELGQVGVMLGDNQRNQHIRAESLLVLQRPHIFGGHHPADADNR